MDKLKSFIKQYFVLVILIVLIILFGCLRPESFLTMSNMFTVIRQSSIMGIATIGLLFVMVAGGIDLSLGSVISVESVLVAVLLTKFGTVTSLLMRTCRWNTGWTGYRSDHCKDRNLPDDRNTGTSDHLTGNCISRMRRNAGI